ncbi:hypothetical protein BHAP_0312 [Bifidobacterium hapali]|uniref:Uncharacterized protein n=1 Tax=Bifidobacterium hapali TaxID=1630172 RepID=A0A261G4V1_9BIFI|nr:hypothetical protein [Bifidobacterium hapali]OZG66450.1 hypothetical protein BHAP_0312 [Bifidobacterium hapali]
MLSFYNIAIRAAAVLNNVLDQYFTICRNWMAEQLSHADNDAGWFAMWYPTSVNDMA